METSTFLQECQCFVTYSHQGYHEAAKNFCKNLWTFDIAFLSELANLFLTKDMKISILMSEISSCSGVPRIPRGRPANC